MTKEYYIKRMSELMAKSNYSEEIRQLWLKWQKQLDRRIEWHYRKMREQNERFGK